MKIEIVVDPSRPAPPASLVARVAPPPAAAPEAGARSVKMYHPGPPAHCAHVISEEREAVLVAAAVVAVDHARPKGSLRVWPILMLKWRLVLP